MASNFSAGFPDSGRGPSLSRQQQDDLLDLDAIIEQLGELESQLSHRESEIQASSDASLLAERSVHLDRELSSVLRELSDLESAENYSTSIYNYFPADSQSTFSDDGSILRPDYLTFENDGAQVSFPNSESKNSFGTLSSQSSHSSGASTESGKSVQTLVRVFSADGSCKTVAVDDQTTVGKVCETLVRKNRVAMPLNWAIVEQLPALHMERILEDHLLILDQLNLWTKDSKNRLVFSERPEKYSIFNDPELKEAAANNSFSPAVDGFLHFRLDGKKTWKKIYFVLRASGLYYNPKGKGKSAADLICLQPLKGFDFYFGINWKKNFKSPTDFGFALKMPMIQKEVPKFVRFFCLEDKRTLMNWVTAFRLVKHGHQLHDSFVHAQSWVLSEMNERRPKVKSLDTLDVPKNLGSPEVFENSFHLEDSVLSDAESDVVFTHSRKNSTEFGTLKKSIPNLPITTSLTRHLSMQHQNLTRTLPRSSTRSIAPGSREPDSPALPSNDGNFMKFPSPDFSLDREMNEPSNKFLNVSSTLPRKSPNGMPLFASQSVRNQRTPDRYATLRARPSHKDQSPSRVPGMVPHSQSSGCGFDSQMSPDSKLYTSKSFVQKVSNSLDDVFDNYGFLASSTQTAANYQDLPLPPPPPALLMQPGGSAVVASDQNLPLPPPPPELMPVASQHLPQPDSGFPVAGKTQEKHQHCPPTSPPPPPPPVRNAGTRLSVRGVDPRTRHIIHDLDRVMTQKQEQGADGLAHLEIPLPPPPVYDPEFDELLDVDLYDLPPPPAEILEGLKNMRNRPLPPIPTAGSAFPRPMFSKVI